MALKASAVTVTDSAAVLLAQNGTKDSAAQEGAYWDVSFLAKNTTGTATVYVGGSDVTSGTGFPWETSDGSFCFPLKPGEELYAILASGDDDQTVSVLQEGR